MLRSPIKARINNLRGGGHEISTTIQRSIFDSEQHLAVLRLHGSSSPVARVSMEHLGPGGQRHRNGIPIRLLLQLLINLPAETGWAAKPIKDFLAGFGGRDSSPCRPKPFLCATSLGPPAQQWSLPIRRALGGQHEQFTRSPMRPGFARNDGPQRAQGLVLHDRRHPTTGISPGGPSSRILVLRLLL
jgi:hypothetical protein